MKFIATDIEDSPNRLEANVASQKSRPGFAIDNYFYRSHVTYARELDRIFYKSWLYAGHVSQVPTLKSGPAKPSHKPKQNVNNRSGFSN